MSVGNLECDRKINRFQINTKSHQSNSCEKNHNTHHQMGVFFFFFNLGWVWFPASNHHESVTDCRKSKKHQVSLVPGPALWGRWAVGGGLVWSRGEALLRFGLFQAKPPSVHSAVQTNIFPIVLFRNGSQISSFPP